MELDLKGRSILVTGGSGGIGSIVAEQFAQEGADVTIAARARERLEQTKAEIASRAGVDVRVAEMDVTDAASVASAVQSVLDSLQVASTPLSVQQSTSSARSPARPLNWT